MRKVAFLLGKSLFISAILFFNSFSGNAQITETSLRGMVSDSSGNVIVASAVVAQNDATAQISTTTTNENGEFAASQHPFEAPARGFRTSSSAASDGFRTGSPDPPR